MSKRVVSFHYTVTNASGAKLDSSLGKAPLTVLEGAGQIIPGLESALRPLNAGDKKKISVAAADAYGAHEKTLVTTIKRDQLPAEDVNVGDRFRGGEDEHARIFIVTEIGEAGVTLDGNHPLAGQDLVFDVEIMEARPATEEELQHGHAHGGDGHAH